MPINIAVPSNPFYDKMLAGERDIAGRYGVSIVRAGEKKCSELFMANLVDAALLSPIGYGKGVKIADFRIIDGPSYTAYGYTGIASLLFRKDALRIDTAASPEPDDFLMIAGKILLAERYNLTPNVIKMQGNTNDLLMSAQAAMIWGKASDGTVALDITEDWTDTFETSLPFAFWTCRAEEYPENIREIISALTVGFPYDDEEVTDNEPDIEDVDQRNGRIIYRWNSEVEESLEQTLQLLYFHQYFPELPAVKILGRD